MQTHIRSYTSLFSCFLVFLLSFPAVAGAFNGPPPGSPPTGDGSIVTNALNNVGIGTTNPGSRLTVRNSSAGTVFAIRNTADTANAFAVSDTGAITAGSVGWPLLTNFPSGCPAGQAVQIISGTPSCIAVGTGTVTSVSVSGGTTGLTLSGGPITTSGTLTIGGTLAVANGGTGAVTAAAARANLGAAASGANSDITSLTGLTTPLSPAQGGTGLSSSGVSGNVLTSNGVGWISSASAGDISGVTAGTGLTGGGVSGAVTLNLAVPVAATNGGTAQTSYTAGDLLFASGVSTLSKRAIGFAGQVLTVSGGGVPVWATPTSGTVTSVSGSGGTTGLTLSGGPITTSGTLTIGGTLAVANGGTGLTSPGIAGNVLTSNGVGSWTSSAPAGDISGVTAGTGLTGGGVSGAVTLNLAVPVAATNGGTAQTTYAAGDLLYASAANTLAKRTIGSAGQVLTVSGGVPIWATPATGIGGSGTTNNIAKFTGASTVGNSQLVDTGTNVGIGLTVPNELLEVGAPTGARMILSDEAGVSRRVLLLQAPSAAQDYARILGYSYGLGSGRNLILQDSGGNVGIGTVAPAQKLDVAGTAQMTGFKLTTGAVNGYVLKSDATGVGTWQAATAGTVTSVSGSGGTTGLTLSGGPITTSGTLTIGGMLAVANGGTGATTGAGARANIGAAASGANSDITSLNGLTTPLVATRGGTGQSSYAPGDLLFASSGFSLSKRTIGSAGQVLTVSATGFPVWSALSAGTVTSVNGSGGTTGLTLSGGPITTSGTLTIGGMLAVANGGTGATTGAGARANIGAAASGANSDITSLTGLTTPLAAVLGGTGLVSPGASGNILTSTGAGWVSQAPPSGGEANTASNVGVGGVGVFKQKTGVNLELKNVSAASGRVSVANDAVNNEIDVDVVESALTHDNIGGTLSLTKGGTGATTGVGARANLGAAASGANNDITSLLGLSTALSVAQGGTGAATLPASSVLIGNGTGAVGGVAPGTSGNILVSNGTAWVSQAPTGTFSSYEIVSGGSTADAGSSVPRAICSAGKKVVGGGCISGAPTVCRITHSYPDTDSSWYCAEYHYEAPALCGYTQAWAICM